MAQAEQPERLRPQYQVSVDDVRQLMGASTPHFALQLRNRIRKLIAGLPPEDPARRLGEQEIARLERLGVTGEIRGEGFQDGQRPLPSLDELTPARRLRRGAPADVNGSGCGHRAASASIACAGRHSLESAGPSRNSTALGVSRRRWPRAAPSLPTQPPLTFAGA